MRQKIQSLDGLRAIAALIVLVSHISNTVGFRPTGFGAGQIGVMIFFCLSGFLMCHVTHEKKFAGKNIWNFFVRRFSRVVPLFVFVVSIAFLTYGRKIFGSDLKLFLMRDWEMFVDHLLLLEGKGVLWTIPVELFFYLLFPIFWFLNRVNWCVIIVAILLVLDVQFLGRHIDMIIIENRPALPIFLILFTKIHYFFIGILAYQFTRYMSDREINFDAMFVLSLLCVFFSYPQIIKEIRGQAQPVWDSVPLMLFIFFLLVSSVTSRLADVVLGNRIMRYLGSISYSLYLTHIIALRIGAKIVGIENPMIYAAFSIVLAVCMADLTYRLIERPSQNFLNKMLIKTESTTKTTTD